VIEHPQFHRMLEVAQQSSTKLLIADTPLEASVESPSGYSGLLYRDDVEWFVLMHEPFDVISI
jgi:hypothetical protein